MSVFAHGRGPSSALSASRSRAPGLRARKPRPHAVIRSASLLSQAAAAQVEYAAGRAPLTLQAAIAQARAEQPAAPIGAVRRAARRGGSRAGARRAASGRERTSAAHLHGAQRHAVRRLHLQRRTARVQRVGQRPRRSVLAAAVGGVPRRRRRRGRRPGEGRRRRARPRRHDRAELLRARRRHPQSGERPAEPGRGADSFSTSRSARSRAAKWRAPTSSKRRSRSSSGCATRRKPS